MGFKFLKSIASAWKEFQPLPRTRRTARKGMDKHFHVGKVKHISADKRKALIYVTEMCNDEHGEMYQANYNIWLKFDNEWKAVPTKSLIRVGMYVAFGFYIQSFRNPNESDSYENVITCRFINPIPTEREALSLAIDLSESRLFVDHHYLRLSNVNFKL